MKRSIKQLRAISYAYAIKQQLEVERLLEIAKEQNIFVKVSRYPAVTKRRLSKVGVR